MVGFAEKNQVSLAVAAFVSTVVTFISVVAAQGVPSPYPAEPPPPVDARGVRVPSTPPPAASPPASSPQAIDVTPPPADLQPPAQIDASTSPAPAEFPSATGLEPQPSAADAAAASGQIGSRGEPLAAGRAAYIPPEYDEDVQEVVSNRELGGHYFPLAVFVPPALTFSYFGVRAGIEYHSVPGYSRDLSFFTTNYSRANLETINAAETVDIALRLHDYIALLGSAYGLARVGANAPTLLGTGADYTYGGDLGLLIKLFRVAGFQLAVRGEAGYFAGQQAGIIGLFKDIGAIVQTNINELAQTQDVRDIDLPARLADIENSIRAATTAMLTPFRGFEYGGSLNAAQSLGSAFGLQLSFGLFGKAESYDIPVFDAAARSVSINPRDVGKFWPRLSVAFDADLGSVGLPVDLMAEYTLTRLSVTTNSNDQQSTRAWTEHLVALGIYYAGSLNLQLGVMAYIQYGHDPIAGENALPSGRPLDIGSQFVFRYLR
jgi:hypothetical protein